MRWLAAICESLLAAMRSWRVGFLSGGLAVGSCDESHFAHRVAPVAVGLPPVVTGACFFADGAVVFESVEVNSARCSMRE
jgi:hypothetical protein